MCDKQLKISVVIPTYNREKYITRCLDSVINQSYLPYEVLLVDDGSNDNTVQIARDYPSSLVRVIATGERGGAQHVRNIGIKEAKGDWIAFLDSDDTWIQNKLELQVKEVNRTGYTVCAGGAHVKTQKKEYDWLCDGSSGYVFHDVLCFKTYIFFQAVLVKRENLFEIGLLDEDTPAYQELDLGIRLARKYAIAFINKPLFEYNIHSGATISKDRAKSLKAREYLFRKYKEDIVSAPKTKALAAWYRAFAGEYSVLSPRFYLYLFKYFKAIVRIGRLDFKSQ